MNGIESIGLVCVRFKIVGVVGGDSYIMWGCCIELLRVVFRISCGVF